MRMRRNTPSSGQSMNRGPWVGRGLAWSRTKMWNPGEFCEKRSTGG